MADIFGPNVVGDSSHNPFHSWDAFDRLFDEALSRTKSYPLSPDISSPLPMDFPEPYTYTHAGATPYAPRSPLFGYSDEDLGFSGPEDRDRDDSFDRSWDEGLNTTRRSTVTTSKTLRRSKHTLESSASNSTSTSTSKSINTSRSSSGPPVTPAPPLDTPREATKPSKLQRRKSKVNFKDSADGRTVSVTFELPGIKKSDVHVSYQNDKVVVSWESVSVEEKVEGNQIVRERREKRYVRTLPLPEGTKFEQVKASMDSRRLVLTYPKLTRQKPVQIIEVKAE